jgi:hypothetical protein
MLAEGRQSLSDLPDDAMRADLREKFAQRERALVDTLTHELRLSSDVRVQHMSGGPGTAPKAARKAIRLPVCHQLLSVIVFA